MKLRRKLKTNTLNLSSLTLAAQQSAMNFRISMLVLILLTIGVSAFAQNKQSFSVKIEQHIEGEGDEVFTAGNVLFVTERDSVSQRFYLKKYDLNSGKKIGEVKLPDSLNKAPGFAIEGDFIYLHYTGVITKFSMSKQKQVWRKEYGSNWSAHIGPELLGDYVGIALDDLVLLLDKETGITIAEIRGDDFDQSIFVVDDYFFYGYFEDEILVAHNIKTNKQAWQMNLGGDLAVFAPLPDGNTLYLPSSRANMYALNKKTGKQIWKMEAGEELMNSCGSGFNGQPILYKDTLYNLQRETGLWVIDKNAGKVADTIDFYENVSWQIHEYKGQFIIVGEETIYSFNPANRAINELMKIPDNDACYPTVSFSGTHIILEYIGCYDLAPKVEVYNLEMLVNVK
ncbi:MAG: PQQ-binding-like beta-propeller repeat protein [Bacteroidia bacterium]